MSESRFNQNQKAYDDYFIKDLLTRNPQGNTKLYTLAQDSFSYSDKDRLSRKLRQLSEPSKTKLLTAMNENNETLLHTALRSWSRPDYLILAFGESLRSDALYCRDKQGNTPFNSFLLRPYWTPADGTWQFVLRLLDPHTALTEMKEQANVKVLDYAEAASEMKQANANAEAAQDTPGIMTRLHSWLWYSPASAAPSNGNAESKQAALYANISFDRLFAQNTQDLMNPWHLLAKREDISSHPQCCSLFETLSRLLPGNLCVEKILEKDKKGLTPLHHAIKSRNFELAVKMLDFLNPDQRKEIFAIQHNKNETLLHYICQHGDAHFLGFVLQILGHKEFYKIHRQLPLKHYAANLSIHKNDFEQIMKKYTTLPDFFAYFEKKFDPKKIGQEQSEDYKNRLQDFFDCLTAIQKDISLPAAKASFSAKTYGFGKFQFQGSQEYLEMRLSLDQVKKGELNQFIEFFIDEAIKATAAGSSSFVTEFYAAWMLYQAQTATSEDKNEPLRLGELTGEAAQRFALWANPKQQSVLPTTDAPPSYFEAIASAPPASAPPPYEMPLPSAPYMREQEEQKNPLLNPGIRGL